MPTLADRPDLERVSTEPRGAMLVRDLNVAHREAIDATFGVADDQPLKRVIAAANRAFDVGQAMIDRERTLCDALAATRAELALARGGKS